MTPAEIRSQPGDSLEFSEPPVLIIGGGPSGIAAAHRLSEARHPALLIEQSSRLGGIARTEEYRGFFFDIGGHRFFTKNEEIDSLWHRMLKDRFRRVVRNSRIYYQNQFFKYPLKPFEAMAKFGPWESARVILSYLDSHRKGGSAPRNLEEWMIRKFGRRLYELFFERYTEKVWGIPCREIESDWADQRISGLSLAEILRNFLHPGRNRAKSLIESFHYPVRGPGMMWDRFAEDIANNGGRVLLQCRGETVFHDTRRILAVQCSHHRVNRTIPCRYLLSSMPLSHLIRRMDPPPPREIRHAAEGLRFRSLIQVCLIIRMPTPFPDQWIYIHDPGRKVGRIQNFRNWSAAMSPDPAFHHLGMEYFCNRNDSFWNQPDADLISLAAAELEALELGRADQVSEGFVIREPFAYPIYDRKYREHIAAIRSYLSGFENLVSMGRNGMHRYNNMDHAMLTGRMAAENVLGASHNLWNVNEDAAYLEKKP